jgi:hypothetical protein
MIRVCPRCAPLSEMECSCPQWHQANPYPLPAKRLEDKSGYPWNTLPKWQGSVLAPPASSVAQDVEVQQHSKNVADIAGACSVKARTVGYRMRYRREARQAPGFIKRWG